MCKFFFFVQSSSSMIRIYNKMKCSKFKNNSCKIDVHQNYYLILSMPYFLKSFGIT